MGERKDQRLHAWRAAPAGEIRIERRRHIRRPRGQLADASGPSAERYPRAAESLVPEGARPGVQPLLIRAAAGPGGPDAQQERGAGRCGGPEQVPARQQAAGLVWGVHAGRIGSRPVSVQRTRIAQPGLHSKERSVGSRAAR